MNLKNKRALQKILIVLLLILMVFLYDYIINSYMNNYEVTNGVIISHSEWKPRGGHIIKFQFIVDGIEITHSIRDPTPLECFNLESKNSCRGEEVKIRYSQKNPIICEIIRE